MLEALAQRTYIVEGYKKSKAIVKKKKKIKKDIWKTDHDEDGAHDAYQEQLSEEDAFSDDEHAEDVFRQRDADHDYDPEAGHDNLNIDWG